MPICNTKKAIEATLTTSFSSTLQSFGNNTGIEVPAANITDLNAGKKPSVIVQINNYTYRSTVAVMEGKYLISFSKAHRLAAGIKGGDKINVTLELDTSNRNVELPKDMENALHKAELLSAFKKLAPSHKKEYVRWITEAKKPETRASRIEKMLQKLSN